MSLIPVVTYISVAYTTATEAPNVSETEIALTTTVLPTPIGMSSTLPSPTATTPTLSPASDTTCSTTTSSTTSIAGLITSFVASSDISSSSTFTTSPSSTYSPIPVSATLAAPIASSSGIPVAAQTSRSTIGLPGTIGLSTALGIFFAAIIAIFCYYRRKRKSHKEAMLIAPRLSHHKHHRSIETGNETLVGSNSSGVSFDKDVELGRTQSVAPARYVMPIVSSDTASIAYHTYMPRSSSLNPAGTKPTEGLDPVLREQSSPGNNIYGIRYNTGGILSVEHETPEEKHPGNDQNRPRWNEAMERLNAIHAATLHRELSPAPLRILKGAASDLENRVVAPARNILSPVHNNLESISELDILDSPRDKDIERRRAAALAKLEGRYGRYTTESVYSRSSDGNPLHRPEEREGQPQWKNSERHWPD